VETGEEVGKKGGNSPEFGFGKETGELGLGKERTQHEVYIEEGTAITATGRVGVEEDLENLLYRGPRCFNREVHLWG